VDIKIVFPPTVKKAHNTIFYSILTQHYSQRDQA